MIRISHGILIGDIEQTLLGQELLAQWVDAHSEQTVHSGLAEVEFNPNNLMVNGSFEFHSYGWKLIDNPGATIRWTAERAHSGTKSLALRFDGRDVNFYTAFQQISVRPDTCYRLEAYISSQELTDGVALELWDANRGHNHWYGGQTARVQGSVGWTPVIREFCTGNDVDEIQVRLRRYGGAGHGVFGTAWFDDVSLIKLVGGSP